MSPEQSLHNAAVLMRHLAEDEASAVFATLSPGLAGRLQEAMAKNEAQAPAKFDEIPVKYTPVAASHSQLVQDAGRYVRQILSQAFAEEFALSGAAPIVTSMAAPTTVPASTTAPARAPLNAQAPASGSGLERLKRQGAAAIAQLCQAEHPQVVAALLVQLERPLGAAALNHLPLRLQADVMLRVATLQNVHPMALRVLDEAMGAALDQGALAAAGSNGGLPVAIELIGRTTAGIKGTLMDAMRQQDMALAQKISRSLNLPGARP